MESTDVFLTKLPSLDPTLWPREQGRTLIDGFLINDSDISRSQFRIKSNLYLMTLRCILNMRRVLCPN